MMSSWRFHPLRASEESTEKVQKASTYPILSRLIEMPPHEIRSSRGHFLVLYSVEGVGGKYPAGSESKHLPPPAKIERDGTTRDLISKSVPGSFLRRRASEESTRKVQKASTHAACVVRVDVGVPHCHCAPFDEHPAALPNKGGRRRKVRGRFR